MLLAGGLVAGLVVAVVLGVWLVREEPSVRDLVRSEVDAAASRDSEQYVEPTSEQAERVAAAVAALARDDVEQAEAVRDLGYSVRELDHDGRRLLALVEDRSPRRHWGTYVVAPRSSSRLLVEVPHPLSDLDTPQVGLQLFTRTGGRALLLAGAHRDAGSGDSADVAHRRDSVFEAVHRALLSESSVVAQLHGFDDGRRDDPDDVVLSNGTDDPPRLLRRLQEDLSDEGFGVCLFQGGPRCRDLAARTNVQGRSTRAAGGSFVHLELAPSLRRDPDPRGRLVEALATSLEREQG